MTATTDRPTARPGSHLGRAAGIELLGELQGSGYRDGAALVRRADGQVVQVGPLMYALLEALDGRSSAAELADALSRRLDRRVDEEHVRRLADKLAAQGLLSGTEHRAPPRRNPLLALRWRVLVTNRRITRAIAAPFTFLFMPWLLWPMVACFAAVAWFVLVDKGVGAATNQAFRQPEWLLLVFVLAVLSAGFHEVGHASACRYGGAAPGGMGVGIYLVWPAFYTDVTDAYRLPRRDRLRVDLGGMYFNAVIAVVTTAAWLVWRVDALLLLVALQLLIMVKNLSPVIRSDGYHILADATGVPDLFAHIGPTIRALLPWRRRDPSSLTGRARILVTVWVLVVVPVLLSLMLGAVLLLPRLVTSAWASGHAVAAGMPHEDAAGVLASCLRLVALLLPVLGSALVTQRIVRMGWRKGQAWSAGRPVRRTALTVCAAGAACGAAWALWPAGQYQPVGPTASGTIASAASLVSPSQSPSHLPAMQPVALHLAPGRHLAVAMIPVGGATNRHPALFVIEGHYGRPAVAMLSTTASPPATADVAPSSSTTAVAPPSAPTTTTGTTTMPAATTARPSPATTQAVAFPFQLPGKPGPGDTEAVAVGRTAGGVVYDVAYSIVTVTKGAPVTNTNGAYALASCNGCTTVAVSFQIVLVVGRSAIVAPIDLAEALNSDCPACMTTAVADQLVVTLESQPTKKLVTELDSALQQLNALPVLGASGTPAAVAAQVGAVQQQVVTALDASGQLATPIRTTTTPATTSTTSTTPGTTTAPATTTPAATATTTTPKTTTAPSTTGATTTSPTTATTPTTTTTTTTTTGTTTTGTTRTPATTTSG